MQRKYHPSLQDPKEKDEEAAIPLLDRREIINRLIKRSTIHEHDAEEKD